MFNMQDQITNILKMFNNMQDQITNVRTIKIKCVENGLGKDKNNIKFFQFEI